MATTVTPKFSLHAEATQGILAKLFAANTTFNRHYPGESGDRQPVHTVYGGAQLFKSDTARKVGTIALRTLQEHAPNSVLFARVIGLPGSQSLPESMTEIAALEERIGKDPSTRLFNPAAWLAYTLYARVVDKLSREAVEDYRIDFEDGYGNRPDDEEDQHAASAAHEVAMGMQNGTLPPFLGIRIKPFTEELRVRSIRTLDIFLSTLVAETRGKLPENFVVTLPKVTIPEQVQALVALFELLEGTLGLEAGSLKVELMIETPQSIINHQGEVALPALVRAAEGRCTSAHFGTYDYTAGCSITAAYQHMRHASCDFAKHLMQVSLAGTGVMLSDGATTLMPIGPHRPGSDGTPLTSDQVVENRMAVHRAWKQHYDDARHSLANGFYQGWDLNPGQLPTRYGAVYAFFLEGLEAASARLKNFVEKAAQATLAGGMFDDAATGQGLLNFFLRGISCGAITEEEALVTGLTLEELRSRSFVKILAVRTRK